MLDILANVAVISFVGIPLGVIAGLALDYLLNLATTARRGI